MYKFSNILELGPSSGYSTILFMLNTDAKVTSVNASSTITSMFPDRIVTTDINNTLYDLVYFDSYYGSIKKDFDSIKYMKPFVLMNNIDIRTSLYAEIEKEELLYRKYGISSF